jgi:FkbM family methyltransferase|tara:strand:+ start:1156 stop:1797 length:642 start_codon:yes stop_codon:yes gene_type:complete
MSKNKNPMSLLYNYYISDSSEIDFLIQHYKIQPTGFVHVGAHRLEEKGTYSQYVDNDKMLWVEANEDLVKLFPKDNVIHALIGMNDDEEMDYLHYNNSKLNSVLELVDEDEKKKGFEIVSSTKMKMKRMDTILKDIDDDYDFLVIDVQGYEGEVISSLGSELKRFKYIFVETSDREIYKNGSLLNNITPKLQDYKLKYHRFLNGFGNAFYVRN